MRSFNNLAQRLAAGGWVIVQKRPIRQAPFVLVEIEEWLDSDMGYELRAAGGLAGWALGLSPELAKVVFRAADIAPPIGSTGWLEGGSRMPEYRRYVGLGADALAALEALLPPHQPSLEELEELTQVAVRVAASTHPSAEIGGVPRS